MRFAAYAGASTALAFAVILHAFNQRPNFYSAVVYLAQSQACRMILLNLLLLSTYAILRTLQKALYGPLRAIEREQLWDKSWYAITETALAMTTFRDEVGFYFLVMFGTLLAGKVWTWISESRVDMLEQQPPANPRLFHARMLASLFISEVFDIVMLNYCVNTLINQPRPGMMVMYAFEFAVLFITSSSVTLRYVLSLNEIVVTKKQTQAKVEERRAEIRAAREDAERQGSTDPDAAPPVLEREEDVDENDFDVPGWEGKGKYVLFLDLFTDFMKLVVYMFFFAMLLLFHGIPIHIIRDVYLTMRSFIKRISDFQKYRNATKDMNARYPDATAQELERDGTCIICREDMRPWEQPAEQAPPAEATQRPARTAPSPPDERQRPKKLPCGHVLHLGCLKSWLERQQVCPTCRTSVLAPGQAQNGQTQGQPGGAPGNGAQGGAGANNNPGAPGQHGQNVRRGRNAHPNVAQRHFRLGNWRFAFAAGPQGEVQQALDDRRNELRQLPGQQPPVAGANGTNPQPQLPGVNQLMRTDPTNIDQQLHNAHNQITHDIQRLHLSQQQLDNVRRLQLEYSRLRLEQSTARLRNHYGSGPAATAATLQPQLSQQNVPPRNISPQPHYHPYGPPHPGFQYLHPQMAFPPLQGPFPQQLQHPQTQPSVYSSPAQQQVLRPGDSSLPAGMTLPEGWNMMPLQRAGPGQQQAGRPGTDPLDLPDLGLPQVLQQTTERAAIYQLAEAADSTARTADFPSSMMDGTTMRGAPNAPPIPPPTHQDRANDEWEPSLRNAISANNTAVPDWTQGNDVPAELAQSAGTHETAQLNNESEPRPQPAPQDAREETSEDTPASTSDKGKARAARVEDATDDADPEAPSRAAADPSDGPD